MAYNEKRQRSFVLTVQDISGKLQTISSPLTCEFTIQRDSLLSFNTAVIKVYNLNPERRALLRHDPWSQQPRPVSLAVGYADTPKTIFNGTAQQISSYRDGTEFVTEIQALDGNVLVWNSEFPATPQGGQYRKGAALSVFADDVLRVLESKNIQRGVIYPITGSFTADKTISGYCMEELTRQIGNGWFIDMGKINYIPDNGYNTKKKTFEINKNTGLLGTPKVFEQFVEVELVFEPSISIMDYVHILSKEYAQAENLSPELRALNTGVYNGYNMNGRVSSINHSGIVSENSSGRLTTRILVQKLAKVQS